MASLMTEYIQESKDQEIPMSKLYYKEKSVDYDENPIIILSDCILEKYRGDLDTITYTKTLTDEEYLKYRYKPNLLSYDLYGTTEYWSLLLDLNELTSFIEFDLNPIKVYTKDLTTLIGKILNLEKESIDLNEEEIR